ncbi:hypothetical protein HI914_04102 [Erysiphe necator]|nr:hypothetical protein HI914_04102 [Erysiphe necator]
MANQQTAFDFHISQNYQPFKLIELPPDLLESLESASPPILSIVSASTSASAASSTALLIHGSQKYKMNSKNSSNTTLLLQPSPAEFNAASGSHSTDYVTAIAQCDETIELVPLHENPEKEIKKINKWHEKFAKSKKG